MAQTAESTGIVKPALPSQKLRNLWTGTPSLVLFVVAFKLVFHLLLASRYGYYVDELYFLACSHHMAWGYPDQPPLIVLITFLVRHSLGVSLFALRLLPAIAGAAFVWLCALLAREMGGGRFAQLVAAVAALVTPIYIAVDGTLMMNAFDPLIWAGCAYLLLLALRHEELKYWIWLGAVIGVGFENKYLIGLLVVGLIVGLALGPQRAALSKLSFWLAALIALIIFLPNFLWQARFDFPFLIWQKSIRATGELVNPTAWEFFRDQFNMTLPAAAVWIAGIFFFLFSRRGRQYSYLGWAFVLVFASLWITRSKTYYVGPAYGIAYSGGAVFIEEITQQALGKVLRKALLAVMLIVGGVLAPFAAPILPIGLVIPYSKFLGLSQKNVDTNPPFASQLGWPELVSSVARLYDSIPPNQRAQTGIFAPAYGPAAAIDLLGQQYGLPKAISTQLSYFEWGPRNYSSALLIMVGPHPQNLARQCALVVPGPPVVNPHGYPSQRGQIVNLCVGGHFDLQRNWPRMGHF